MSMTQIRTWIFFHLGILDPDLDPVFIKMKRSLSNSFYNLNRFILYPENL